MFGISVAIAVCPGRDEEWCGPILVLNINVAVSFNQLFSEGLMPNYDCFVQWCIPIFVLKVDLTACSNKLLRHALMPIFGRQVEWSGTVPLASWVLIKDSPPSVDR